MPEEFCRNGPSDSPELRRQVDVFDSGSNWADYCLSQAASCYGHGLFHASIIFAGEALEARLGELNATITRFESLVDFAPLGQNDKDVAHSIRVLRHYHAHPPPRLTDKTKAAVGEVTRKWGIDVPVPNYVKEILEKKRGEMLPDKIRMAFNRPELAKKCIQEVMRLLNRLKATQ